MISKVKRIILFFFKYLKKSDYQNKLSVSSKNFLKICTFENK